MSPPPKFEVLTIPMEKIESGEPGSVVYCTVVDKIELLGPSDEIQTVFGKICIQFQEFSREGSTGIPYRAIDSRMSVEQISTTVRFKVAGDVSFEHEFFFKSSPGLKLISFDIGNVIRECLSPKTYIVDMENKFDAQPEILPQAHHMAMLHIKYYSGLGC